MNQRDYKADAVVLRRIATGETDRVLVLFTREKGKLSAIAKGARRPLSRLGGGSEPFMQSTVQLAVGQNLDVLTQCRVERSFPGLRRDMERMGYAAYMLEVVDSGLAERQPQPQLWDLLVASLTLLEDAGTPAALVRAFELNALSLMGYQPELGRCVRCHGEVDAPGAAFHPLRGGMHCAACAARTAGTIRVAPDTVRLLRAMLARPMKQFQSADLPEAQEHELARCLVPYVRHTLEAPLRSLQYLEAIG